MIEGTWYFVVGAILVAAAIILTVVGLRDKEFPRSGRLLSGVAALFALLVAGTTVTAVVNAREEQEHRHELEQIEAEEAAGEPVPGTSEAEAEAATELGITSPEDGSLSFEPDSLEAPPGLIAIAYDNPSPVAHDVAVERDGEVLGESDLVTNEATTLSVELEAGEYIFFCTVPGHREGGMEGTLTVD